MRVSDKRKEIHYLDYEESRAIYMGWLDSYKAAVAEKDEMLTKVMGGSIRYDKMGGHEAVRISFPGECLASALSSDPSRGRNPNHAG